MADASRRGFGGSRFLSRYLVRLWALCPSLALLVDVGSLTFPHDQAHDSTTLPSAHIKSPLSRMLVAIHSHSTRQAQAGLSILPLSGLRDPRFPPAARVATSHLQAHFLLACRPCINPPCLSRLSTSIPSPVRTLRSPPLPCNCNCNSSQTLHISGVRSWASTSNP